MAPRTAHACLGAFRVLLALSSLWNSGCDRPPRASGPLHHEAYVWQRDWNSNVLGAVTLRGPLFHRIVPLAAEIQWRDRQPQTLRVALDYDALRSLNEPIGLALRIGSFSGPFASDDATTRFLVAQTLAILGEADAANVEVGELQIDFDCAERNLDGYRIWVDTLRASIQPTPIAITALPSWLKRGAFAPLARSAGSFVLQVHSLEPPRGPDGVPPLCDPETARQAVEQAARCGVPFRVALPTYGYLIGFGRDGKFLGLAAEATPRAWPAAAIIRELRADPVALAGLVGLWTVDRPATLAGVIWYRLPVPGDRLNWRWPTLEAVMDGQAPFPSLLVETHRPETRLTELRLRNAGRADYSGPVAVEAHWPGSPGLAADGVGGFDLARPQAGTVLFTNPTCRLPVDAVVTIGWVRQDTDERPTLELLAPAAPPPH